MCVCVMMFSVYNFVFSDNDAENASVFIAAGRSSSSFFPKFNHLVFVENFPYFLVFRR